MKRLHAYMCDYLLSCVLYTYIYTCMYAYIFDCFAFMWYIYIYIWVVCFYVLSICMYIYAGVIILLYVWTICIYIHDCCAYVINLYVYVDMIVFLCDLHIYVYIYIHICIWVFCINIIYRERSIYTCIYMWWACCSVFYIYIYITYVFALMHAIYI